MPEASPPERRPIVPDPDASLSRPRRPLPPPPRLWPLRAMLLLLLLAVGALAWFGWQAQQRLDAQWQRLAGEISNLHARFDAEEGRGERLAGLETRLAALEGRGDFLEARTTGLELALEQVTGDEASRLDGLEGQLETVNTRLDDLTDQAATRDALLAAQQVSLDALERAGEEARQALAIRLERVAEAGARRGVQLEEGETRLEQLAEAQHDTLARLEQVRQAQAHLREALVELDEDMGERHTATVERLALQEARLAGLSSELEAQVANREDDQQVVVGLQGRLAVIETELRELRQAQLALSAGLEALQP
jgi:chromosome segregation ATPase